jgi:GWxTD domain-containing protein
MRKNTSLLLLAIVTLASSSCHLYRLEKNLEGEDAVFLSQVRYIITREERKRYLEVPKTDRGKFQDEFWKKRDPDPDTETNEFRTEYFDRMAEADRLFTANRPGRLTDRGKTLILLGPPDNKSVYPMGNAAEGLIYPSEVWYYPTFPVIFIDQEGTGLYQYYFTGLVHQAEVLEALLTAKQFSSGEAKALFDYDLALRREGERDTVVIRLKKPDLWMTDEAGNVKTTLEIKLQIRDPSDQTVWERMFEHPVSLSGDEIARGVSETESITFDVALPPGDYILLAWIKNRTDGELRSKAKAVKIARKSTERSWP